MAFVLTAKDVQRMNGVLNQLMARAEAQGGMVCDFSGHVLTEVGFDSQDPMLISALGAGVFAASRELARLLGEDEFSSVIHQGEKRGLFICAVDRDTLLVVAFSVSASMGLVKLYARPAVAELRALFVAVQERAECRPSDEQSFVLNDAKEWFGSEEPPPAP